MPVTMKGMVEMIYFTAGEVQALLSGASLELCTRYDDNPNREAFEACIRFAGEVWNSKVGYAASGFLLGYATGLREQHNRVNEDDKK
ncbi:hypothetical protein SDC9_89734 [bioreactor metagenome]|uniref:Uncharacterized protein n=1 Tax=bioreactor metagenome TaxID=1076179 RepID=A0A644ZT35_9ZZZZ